jgi:hypothetical protein
MKIKEKFESIDQNKLSESQKEILAKIKSATKDFTIEDEKSIQKVDGALDNIIDKLKKSNPEAIKKESKKVVDVKVKKTRTKKQKVTPKAPQSGKRTVFSVAKEIRKADETWEDAKKRAKKVMETEKEITTKKMKSETEKLLAFIKRRKELEGLSGTTISKDAKIEALPKGRRISKNGKTYYENRDNRTDRLAPNFEDKIYLADGGGVGKSLSKFRVGESFKYKDNGKIVYKVTKVYNDGACEARDEEGDNYTFEADELSQLQEAKYELGGSIIGIAETPLARDLGIDYTGLVGETGAMSSGEMFAKGGLVVTSIADIPNFEENLEDGKITYRGLGMGKLSDDFFEKTGTSGTRIKVEGKEYFITDKEFNSFSRGADGKMRIKFDAPERKGYADGGSIIGIAETPLARDLGIDYTGLVGETSAMSSGEMFMNGGGVKDISERKRYTIGDLKNMGFKEFKGDKTFRYYFEKGGNKYEFKVIPSIGINSGVVKENDTVLALVQKYEVGGSLLDGYLTDPNFGDFQNTIFARGGRMLTPRERYIAELKGLTGLRQSAIENFIDENNLTNDEILNIVIGLGRRQINAIDVSTAVVGTKDNAEFIKLMAFAKSNKALTAYKEGGRVVNVVNEDKEYSEEKYQGIFGDYDGDGVTNVNDLNPLDKKKVGRVDNIEIDETFRKLIDLKNDLDVKMYEVLDELDKKAPKNAEFYARTKTPFSIVKKLVDKRLLDPKKGLTDLIGTTVVVSNQKELEKVKKDLDNGLMGDVLDFDDFYENPNNGYRAYHYIVLFKGTPIEVQLKTKMQKQLNEVSHEFYKKGTLNAKGLNEVSEMIMKADKGDKKALEEVKMLLANESELSKKISIESYAMGGGLDNHGLKEGDRIVKTLSGGIQKVMTKSGDVVYVSLANGYRGDVPPLPFEEGGSVRRNLSRDRKFKNYSQKHEVRYSKDKPNRKGYGFAEGGNVIDAFQIRTVRGQGDAPTEILTTEQEVKFKKGGKILESSNYIPTYEVLKVHTKDGKVFENIWSETSVISGVYVSDKPLREKNPVNKNQIELFKKGGIPKTAIYIPRYNVDFIETEKNGDIQGNYIYGGVWVDMKKQSRLLEEAKNQNRFGKSSKFKVDDLVYNKRTKTVGIVRIEDEKGETKTDADGNVNTSELEKYNPLKFEYQKNAKVAPSTQKEIDSRGLFKPFSKFERGGSTSDADKETLIYVNQILRRAVINGDLTVDEANSGLAFEIAEEEVEDFIDDDMEEMGSSDFGYMYKNFIKSYNEVKGKSFASGGSLDGVKLNFDFDTEGDAEFEYPQEVEKIKILKEKVDFDEVTGSVDYGKLEGNTDLKFYKNGKLVMSLKGDYNDKTDELITTIDILDSKNKINYHPYDGLGGVDYTALKKELDAIDYKKDSNSNSGWLKYVKDNISYFDIDDEEDNFVMISTRENGNVGDEEHGVEDVKEAKSILKKIKEKYPNTKGDIYTVDEFVYLELEAPKDFSNGGKTTFKQKSTAIAKSFEGKKVEPKYQKEYGKTYDKTEAKEVGKKIAGSQKAKYETKMSKGGSPKKSGGIMILAKQIRKDGETWKSALNRAGEQLKNK